MRQSAVSNWPSTSNASSWGAPHRVPHPRISGCGAWAYCVPHRHVSDGDVDRCVANAVLWADGRCLAIRSAHWDHGYIVIYLGTRRLDVGRAAAPRSNSEAMSSATGGRS